MVNNKKVPTKAAHMKEAPKAAAKKERMPMWLAVGISVICAIPFGAGFWARGFGIVLWLSFTIWAVYLLFGGVIAGGVKLMVSYAGGAVSASLVQVFALLLIKLFGNAAAPGMDPATKVGTVFSIPRVVSDNWVPITVAYFVGFCVVVWWMKFSKMWLTHTIAYFSGISLTLGCIFTGQGGAYVGGHAFAGLGTVGVIGALLISLISAAAGCLIAAWSVWLNGARPFTPVEQASGF